MTLGVYAGCHGKGRISPLKEIDPTTDWHVLMIEKRV